MISTTGTSLLGCNADRTMDDYCEGFAEMGAEGQRTSSYGGEILFDERWSDDDVVRLRDAADEWVQASRGTAQWTYLGRSTLVTHEQQQRGVIVVAMCHQGAPALRRNPGEVDPLARSHLGGARAVTIDAGRTRTEWMGIVMAHELGHQLGLAHTQAGSIMAATIDATSLRVTAEDARYLQRLQREIVR